MKTKLGLLLVVLSLAYPQKGFPWGDDGHSVTAVVARDLLKQQSKTDPRAAAALQAVDGILGMTSIANAAIWPDQVKNLSRACLAPPYVKDPDYGKGKGKGLSSAVCDAYRYTASWHFVSTEASTYTANPADPEYFKGDMVTVITEMAHRLKGEDVAPPAALSSIATWKAACLTKENHECKKEALEYVIHLVGDSQQPLHSGTSCDVGGNAQQITFFGEDKDPAAYWCGPSSPPSCTQHELHQAWDATMLLRGYKPGTFSIDQYSAKLVRKFRNRKASSDSSHCVTTAPDASFTVDGPNGPSGWVNESLCYQRQVYEFPDDPTLAKNKSALANRKVAANSDIPNRCRSDKAVGEGRSQYYSPVQIGKKYYKENIETIRERLYWGGSRLATLLKDIYGDGDKAPNFDLAPAVGPPMAPPASSPLNSPANSG